MPHTKGQLQQLLEQAQTRPRHHWGQNFLIDLNLMRSFVDTAQLDDHDVVLEVGTGTGSLTSLLAQHAGHVITVEIDPELAGIARHQFAHIDNVTLLHTDALKNKNTIAPQVTDLLSQQITAGRRLKLVANLPYQVAGPLMINLLLGPLMPQLMAVTVQLEVAQRMVASPNTSDYGLLSVLMQATGHTQLTRKLPPQAFWPEPQVHSAMVLWQRYDDLTDRLGDVRRLKDAVDMLLRHRRKKISTCVKGRLSPSAIQTLPDLAISGDQRGETLTVDQFIALAKLLDEPGPPLSQD